MIKYNKKIDRAFDSSTGQFVSFTHARLSSVFREQYEPFMIRKKMSDFEKGKITREEMILQMEGRAIPKKEWQIILPPSEKLSPLAMYTELNANLSEYKYEKLLKEVKKEGDSNRKRKILSEYYDSWVIEERLIPYKNHIKKRSKKRSKK